MIHMFMSGFSVAGAIAGIGNGHVIASAVLLLLAAANMAWAMGDRR